MAFPIARRRGRLRPTQSVAVLSLLLPACAAPTDNVARPLPPVPTASASIAAALPPPPAPPPAHEEDVIGPAIAEDVPPPPPPFDAAAWLSQRGVTDTIPENTQCSEALPSTPGRPDMLLCVTSTVAFSARNDLLHYTYQAGHTVVLSVSGKKLRKIFDVITELESKVNWKPMRVLGLVVRVEDGGAVIVVEDGSDDVSCPSALGRYGGTGNKARARFFENVCKSRGRHVFKNGRFVAAR